MGEQHESYRYGQRDSMTTTFLSENEARHRAILEAALDCVITIDHQGRVVEFNPAAERTFGYERDEALGVPIAELIVPPLLRAAHREGLERCVATGDGRLLGNRVEMPALRSDGSEILVELAVTRVDLPGPPLFTAYLRDISEARRAEEELRRSQELYRLVVLGSKDLIGLVGTDGRIVFASPSHESMLGHQPGSLRRVALATLVHPDDLDSLGEAWSQALAGERGSFNDIRLRHADGTWRCFEGAASGISGDDGVVSMVMTICHDVTEKRDRDCATARVSARSATSSPTRPTTCEPRWRRSLRRSKSSSSAPSTTPTSATRFFSISSGRQRASAG